MAPSATIVDLVQEQAMRFIIGVKSLSFEWFVVQAQFGLDETRVQLVRTRSQAASFNVDEALRIVGSLLQRETFIAIPENAEVIRRDVLVHPVRI